MMRNIGELVLRGNAEATTTLLPAEMTYPVQPTLALRLGLLASQ